VQVCIRRIGHIVINHDIDPFNIDSPAQNIGSDTNPLVEVLEGLVPRDSFFLWEAAVDGDGGEVALAEETVEFAGSTNRSDKNNDLVEFEGIEEVVEFAVLLGFGEPDKVLLEAVQSQLGLVVDVNLEWLTLGEFIKRDIRFA
jgi:hypothetical protein